MSYSGYKHFSQGWALFVFCLLSFALAENSQSNFASHLEKIIWRDIYNKDRKYCKCITFDDVFFLVPLAVDILPLNQVQYASIKE